MLNKRQKETVSILLNADNPILIKELALKFSVSIRTINSDIKVIKEWLDKHHILFHSQPNKGIWLSDLKEPKKLEVHYDLLMEPADEDVWGVEGRVKRIILLLSLHPSKYVTAGFLADQLLVSRKTIYNDMKQVEKNLDENNLLLTMYPRRGYAITGREVDIRQYSEYLLSNTIVFEEASREDIYQKLRLDLVAVTKDIESNVDLISEKLSMSDKNYIGYSPNTIEFFTLFIRLTIALCRVKKGNQLQTRRKSENVDIPFSKFSSFAYIIIEEVFQAAGYEVSTEEFNYIFRNALLNSEKENVLDLTNNIIQHVSKNLSIPFYEDSKLQSNLLSHLSNRFTEDNAILLEKNPFMEDLKVDFYYLFNQVKDACEKYLIGSRNVSTEIISSFISLHFLVSLETTFADNKPLKALYVCASGRGVVRVIKNRVEREIPQIKVVQYCGLGDLHEVLQEQKFDLVISIFPIDIDIPTVWVEPVPTQRNIEEVKNKVRELSGGSYQPITEEFYQTTIGSHTGPEDVSRDIIIKAMELFVALKEAFKGRIKEKMEDAFLMHVFLMVHRLQFSKEYDHLVNTSFTKTSDYQMVDELFRMHGVIASIDEKKAILFYIEKEDEDA